jgi:diaminopimelate epimerase
MIPFTKAHAYGNAFLYIRGSELPAGTDESRLAVEICGRHTGAGADGLIVWELRSGQATGAEMRLWNADGSRSEVSGNGVRGLAAILLRDDERDGAIVAIQTEGGLKTLTRTARASAVAQTFRAAMGLPVDLRQALVNAAGESLPIVVLNFGNPQCVVLGPLPDEPRFQRLGPALERHPMFPNRTNVEFAHVEAPDRVRILIWERGVGPTTSSGTGSSASAIAAAAFGGASRTSHVIAPGGTQLVEWLDDSVYLTGDAEILLDGTWHRQLPRTR